MSKRKSRLIADEAFRTLRQDSSRNLISCNRIILYNGLKMVKKNFSSEHALYEFIDLIRQHGDWVEAGEV
jgi:hypothetical protein